MSSTNDMPTLEDRTVKIGLACAGGAIEGAIYEIGALCALEEAIEGFRANALHTYIGVSSGAMIASLLANGLSPRAMSKALVAQADPALNMQPEVLFTPAFSEYAHRVALLPETVTQTLVQYLKHPLDLSLLGMLTNLKSLIPVGLFDNEPIHTYLSRVFTTAGRTNDFRALEATLRIVAVNLDSSEIVVFGDESTAHVPISKAVQASTALPVLYCPVEIEGEYYIDGVARKTVHASRALGDGVDLLFTINPIVPVDLRHGSTEYVERSLVELGLPAVLAQTFRTMIHSRMRTGFKNYQHAYPDADLILIEPDLTDYEVFFSNIFSLSKRQVVCENAYASTRRFLRDNADAVAAKLVRNGLFLRHDVLAEERTLFGEAAPKAVSSSSTARLDAALNRLDVALARISG